jgi:hypothetical protein
LSLSKTPIEADRSGNVRRVNQRRDSRSVNPIIIPTLVGMLVVAALYWFVIRDDSDSKDKGSAGPTALPAKVYVAPGKSFLFEYPGNFSVKTGADAEGFVWIGGIGVYDVLNVKRIANVPTSIARIKVEARRALAATPDVTITGEGTETRDGISMVRFDVDSKVDKLTLHSQIYQFSANKVTWQFECESQAHRADIDAACARALDTFKGP